MSTQGIAQIVFYAVVLTVLGYPLGIYMSRIYEAKDAPGGRLLGAVERRFLRVVGVHDNESSEQTWKAYAWTVMIFSVVFFVIGEMAPLWSRLDPPVETRSVSGFGGQIPSV